MYFHGVASGTGTTLPLHYMPRLRRYGECWVTGLYYAAGNFTTSLGYSFHNDLHEHISKLCKYSFQVEMIVIPGG